jgi:hypothetical protein
MSDKTLTPEERHQRIRSLRQVAAITTSRALRTALGVRADRLAATAPDTERRPIIDGGVETEHPTFSGPDRSR